MVRLEENKHQTENKAIEKMPLPTKVYIPLSQHIGQVCSPEVKIGDSVFTGQEDCRSLVTGICVSIQLMPLLSLTIWQ